MTGGKFNLSDSLSDGGLAYQPSATKADRVVVAPVPAVSPQAFPLSDDDDDISFGADSHLDGL